MYIYLKKIDNSVLLKLYNLKSFVMKKILFCICVFINFYIQGQSVLDWQVPVTDANATISIGEGNGVTGASDPTLNSALLPDGSLIGVFFLNDNNEYTCGGATKWNASLNLAVAAWGSESGLDNGFAAGESYNWFVRVCDGDCWPIDLDGDNVIDSNEVLDGIDYISNDAIMLNISPFDVTYVSNGLSALSSADFVEYEENVEEELSCECAYGVAVPNGGMCMILNACDDPTASNYCPGLGPDLTQYFQNACEYDQALEGCTCEEAYNYDSNASVDDGTCLVLSGGCNDSSAANYSGDECSTANFIAPNCVYSGCLCSESYNYNPSANLDDGSCVILSGGCSDATANNYSGDECSTAIFASEDCQYSLIDVDLTWEFSITDANMTVQIGSDVVNFNNEPIPLGSLIGAFFTNDNGELQNAGYLEWTGDQLALPVWASESGLDNGFASGEEIIWGLSIGPDDFLATSSSMNSNPPFSQTFISNGFGQLLSAEFEGELTAVLGCTDPSAYNYSPDANFDNGSCYNLDWEVTPTDCNMTILIQQVDIDLLSISLNQDVIPTGSVIGVFYENENGELICGGSTIWTGVATSLAVWGAEAGLNNGFQSGEEFATWALLIGDQTIQIDDNGATMNEIGWSSTYVCNGFGNLTSVNFEGEYTISFGCTDSTACNYDETAIVDDTSCTYAQILYQDSDGDGLGNPDSSTESCDEISGFVDNNEDPCPNNIDNPNNAVIWYLDEDGDGLGTDLYIVYGCNPPGDDFSDNADDPCPYDSENTDEDNDGICDYEDDCIGEYDALGICNGECVNDIDNDGVCDIDEIYGCQDSSALNFDSSATENDDSCCYIAGCIDASAFNYNSNACFDNGSCIDVLEGCTDSSSFNYDVNANTDDGSCVPFIFGCTDIFACNYDLTVNTDNGTCTYPLEDYLDCNNNCLTDSDSDGVCDEIETFGCTELSAFNYDSSATEDDGSCIEVVYGCTDSMALNYDEIANTDNNSCCFIEGCTDELAYNYNANACFDNSSCIEVIEGCLDPSALNYDLNANTSNDSCCYIGGCTDSSAYNYNSNACFDNGSCVEVIEGCTDSSSFNYNVNANTDDGSCIPFIFGCTDSIACNFNPSANTDNGCTYPEDFYDCNEVCLNDLDSDGICDELEVGGCTNPAAFNYNPQATDSDFCIFPGCLDSGACNFDSEGIYNEVVECEYESCLGCTDSSAENYDSEAIIDNGSCIIIGCTDQVACNYNPNANSNSGCSYPVIYFDCDNNCINDIDSDEVCDELEIFGCTDSSAFNFDLEATEDDGTCIEIILGCLDNASCNYIINANTDDGSCIYPSQGFDCDGNALLLDSPWGNNIGCDPFNTHVVGFAVEGFNIGDFIGLFYTSSDGDLVFSQGIEYSGNNFSFTICGDDQTTSEKDGFDIGESFIWQLWPVGEDCAYSINVDYSESQSSAGEYQVNGISQVISFSGSPLDASAIVTDALCYGDLGSAELIVTGGVAPYQIEDLSSLPVGLNTTVVLDAVGCQFELEFIVQEPDLLTSSVEILNPLCNGGLATVYYSVLGGTPPYQYTDNGIDFYDFIPNQDNELYLSTDNNLLLTAIDANGCVSEVEVVYEVPAELTVEVIVSEPLCYGDFVSAEIIVEGGTAPYEISAYEVSSIPLFVYDFNYLLSGTYTAEVTDANGCIASLDFIVTEPEELSLSFNSTAGEYSNCSSGTAAVFVEGGNGDYEYLWSNGETTAELSGLCAGDYSVTVTDSNGCVVNGLVTVEYLLPEGWEVNETSLVHHIIIGGGFLDDAIMLLDEIQLVPGDYVGVFFNNDDGTQSCGGYVMINEYNMFMNQDGCYTCPLYAYGSDNDYEGFEQGEKFNWRVWSNQTETEVEGFAVYDNSCDDERYFNSNGTNQDAGTSCVLGTVFASHQVIPLNENLYSDWDMISTYMSSEETVQSIFTPVAEELVIIKDATELVYWPDLNIQTLTTLNVNDAYAVKTWAPNEITVYGDFIQPEEISFSLSGWNYMSYPRYYPEDVDVVLSDLASNIKLLKDDEGNLYWPELGINTIGQMEAGEGYILKVLDDQLFSFPSNSDGEIGGSTVAEGRLGLTQTSYFTDIEKTNSNMVIGLPVESWDNFYPENGDELVAFDSENNIVGVTVLNDNNNFMFIWGDDNETSHKDGMISGEEFFIELWDQSTNTIYTVEIDWEEGVDLFSNNGINIASSIFVDKKFENSLDYISCYPNPTSGNLSIEFYLNNDDYVNLSIFNSIGEQVYKYNKNLFTKGINKLPISLGHLSQGLYYIEIQNSEENKNIIIDLTK
tara:strand:- start:7651 stop:14520 length:6870 start_codon:yes stop_codon:yes gene_type:complete